MKKFLFLTDLHSIFIDFDILKKALEEDADHLLLGGDLFECYSAGLYPQNTYIPMSEEWDVTQRVMLLLCEKYKEVTAIMGNHDARPDRRVAEFNLGFKDFASKPLLFRLKDGDVYRNKRWSNDPSKVLHNLEVPNLDSGHPSWFAHIGNTLIAHTEKYSKTPGAIAKQTYEAFFQEKKDIDLVLVGHLHRANIVYTKNVVLVEAPCLCKPPEYAKQNPALRYSSKQSAGYVTFCQDENGALIRESINLKVFNQ